MGEGTHLKKKQSMLEALGMKWCIGCLAAKSTLAFKPNDAMADGLSTFCRLCVVDEDLIADNPLRSARKVPGDAEIVTRERRTPARQRTYRSVARITAFGVTVDRTGDNGEERTTHEMKRLWLAAYKLKKGCVDCGYDRHPSALEFDHVGDDKHGNVAAMVLGKWDRLLAEIAKCEVVCANCHRIRTAERKQVAKLVGVDVTVDV